MKGKSKEEGRNEEKRTSAVVRNKDRCFQLRMYKGCCAGLLNTNSKALCVHLV
jgi:hypothetical protein